MPCFEARNSSATPRDVYHIYFRELFVRSNFRLTPCGLRKLCNHRNNNSVTKLFQALEAKKRKATPPPHTVANPLAHRFRMRSLLLTEKSQHPRIDLNSSYSGKRQMALKTIKTLWRIDHRVFELRYRDATKTASRVAGRTSAFPSAGRTEDSALCPTRSELRHREAASNRT